MNINDAHIINSIVTMKPRVGEHGAFIHSRPATEQEAMEWRALEAARLQAIATERGTPLAPRRSGAPRLSEVK